MARSIRARILYKCDSKTLRSKLRYISQNINENEKQHSTWNRSHCSVLVEKMFCLDGPLVGIFEKMFKNEVEIPQWASLVRTTLLAKNKKTHETKNYRSISCENIMFKLYTGMLASFVTEHCIDNDIITPEQAGGKKAHGDARNNYL